MPSRDDNEHAVDLDVIAVGDDPGVDEELPERSGGGRLSDRRAQVLVAVAVATLLVALVLVRVLTTAGDTHTASGTSPSASSTTRSGGPDTGGLILGEQPVVQCVGVRCDEVEISRVDISTPPGVRAALRAQYPGARIVSALNVMDRTGARLLFRRIVARVGNRTITIVVAPYRTADSDRSGYADDGAGSRVYFEHRRRLVQITVRVSAPVGTHLELVPLLHLGVDDRILSV